jgi:hypothetical protein
MVEPTPFQFLLYGLCVFRLALMISKESGPLFMFKKLRKVPDPKTSLKEGISCPWCVSVWVATPVGLFACCNDLLEPLLAQWIYVFIHIMALSAVAVIVNQAFTKTK